MFFEDAVPPAGDQTIQGVVGVDVAALGAVGDTVKLPVAGVSVV